MPLQFLVLGSIRPQEQRRVVSFLEWRLTGTYLFGFTPPTIIVAKTEKERLCPGGQQLDEGGHHVQCCAKQRPSARAEFLKSYNYALGPTKCTGAAPHQTYSG